MGWQAEASDIESRFETNWGSTTDISWDNVEYEPSEDSSWVEFTILDGESNQVSLGDSPLHRNVGVININIYAPLDTGTGSARALADQAATIFRSVQFSNILCRSPSITRIGNVKRESGSWYQYNVTVPFQKDETF